MPWIDAGSSLERVSQAVAELPRAERADVALLLEGTYPFVSGGVSSWVHQIIRGFPELSFAVIFIGSRAQDYGSMKYEMPPNVVHAEVHYLYDDAIKPEVGPAEGDPEMFQPNHAVDQVGFLAQVIERCIRLWLVAQS